MWKSRERRRHAKTFMRDPCIPGKQKNHSSKPTASYQQHPSRAKRARNHFGFAFHAAAADQKFFELETLLATHPTFVRPKRAENIAYFEAAKSSRLLLSK